VAGCGPDTAIETGLTGVDLSVIASQELDQLSIEGEVDGQEPFEPTLVPDQPRPLDPAGESAVLVVGEDLAGATLVLTVDGLVEDVTRATGGTRVTLVGRQLVEATIELDCVGESCVCDAESCPSGCCDNEACLVGDDPAACGAGGGSCVECRPGDECRAGACDSCDPSSCDGCCNETVCEIGTEDDACGGGGDPCRRCPHDRARCVDHTCHDD
jgi:hypothetical protein